MLLEHCSFQYQCAVPTETIARGALLLLYYEELYIANKFVTKGVHGSFMLTLCVGTLHQICQVASPRCVTMVTMGPLVKIPPYTPSQRPNALDKASQNELTNQITTLICRIS